jgi:L-fuconolactonase
MDLNGVERAVLTQVLGQFDNTYQEQCVTRYPGRFASVGAVDAGRVDAADQVRHWAGRGMIGLRLRPEARAEGADPLAVWRAAADCGLVISCGGSAANMLSPDFAQLVRTFPQMTFLLEQLGGWTRPDCDRSPETWSGILALARNANICLKVPTLGQVAPRAIGQLLAPDGLDAPPAIDPARGVVLLEALDRFGADRLLWGSDYPVVSSREGYANALNWTRAVFAARPPAEIDAIFGGNAQRLFFAPALRGLEIFCR